MKYFFRALLPVLVLAIGWGGSKWLGRAKERPKRPPPQQRVIKTRVLELNSEDYQTVVRADGVVRAHNESALTPEVSGKVAVISDLLVDGGFFSEGDILVELDDADFKTALIAAEAQVARTKAALAQEEARGKQARLNWEDLGYEEEPNELVLRLPQLREAQANVKAAEAGLEEAGRNLTRTKLRAPFDGRVLQKSVALGQSVSPNTPLATVFATDFVEVRLPISAARLPFLRLPESAGDEPVPVLLSDTLSSESVTEWTGQIVGTEGALNADSRELFAIARVDDPFGLRKASADRGPPLRVGQPVAAAIDGIVLDGVVAVPRSSVRQLNRIYLVVDKGEGDVLEPHDIEPMWSDQDFHVVRDEKLAKGVRVATTRLVYAPKESPVEILPDLVPGEEDTEGEANTEEVGG